MDLSNMNMMELQALNKQVKTELERREQQSMHAARQQILDIAKQFGLPLEQLLAGAASKPARAKPYRPVPVRYRHPEQSNLQWTGRGRAPGWVLAWEQQHSSRDGLRVTNE